MVQVPILSGIFTDEDVDFRNAYPRNLIPIPKAEGISNGYLRPGDGIVTFVTGLPGNDRGAINWDGLCYRVSGTKLILVTQSGSFTEIGDVGAGGQSRLDYSFDLLGISSGGDLFLYDNITLKQVTDPDLGTVIDFLWIDGFFMTTDGESLVVTELDDPFAVNPLKFGSSEIDPDPIRSLLKLRNQVYALNTNTIEVFQNVGGIGFPFQRINGAQIPRGVVGTFAAAVFMENIAFVGGGRNEAPSVWIASSGQSSRIATREIDQILEGLTESELALIVCEVRVDKGHQLLYIHLPDQTIVYDGAASRIMQTQVWFTLDSGLADSSIYLARNFVQVYDKFLVGDPTSNRVGEYDDSLSSHWGDSVGWNFNTIILYNEGLGAIIHRLELVSLTGRSPVNSTISTQFSLDGITFSQEMSISTGEQGDRSKRFVWLQQGNMNNWRIQKFKGTSEAFISMSRLEVTLEGLNV